MRVLASVCGQVCTHAGGGQHLGLPETESSSGFHISSAPGNVFSVLGAHKTLVHLHIVKRSPSCALSSAHGQLWNHRSFRTSSKGLGGTAEQAPCSMEDHHPETLLLSPTYSNLSLVCGHSPWQHWYDCEEL